MLKIDEARLKWPFPSLFAVVICLHCPQDMVTARRVGKDTKESKVIQSTQVTKVTSLEKSMRIIGANTPMPRASIAKGTMIPKNIMEIIIKGVKVTRVQSLARKATNIKVM
jgi:hypothetical protein